MEKMNFKIEFLLKKLNNFIPQSKSFTYCMVIFGKATFYLIMKICGFIDPGAFFGHNELEIAYLRWFNPRFY